MKITNKKVLSDIHGVRVVKMSIHSPDIATKAQSGQFVMVMVQEEGERIPLTIVDTTKSDITLIFQEVGLSTKLLGKLETGDSLFALVGPLGHATEIKKFGNVILVAGGVGIAEIYPVAKQLKEAGNDVTVIIGARTKDLLFLEDDLQKASNHLFVTTDDGSYKTKGFTTDVLKELLEKEKYDLVYAVGPIPMMKAVSMVTKDFKIKTLVSLNALMLDATGMCGCCRVTIGGEVKFSCVDGPEFDAHLVDWDELAKRVRVYEKQEKHICAVYDV
ncbi:sulfide/dihydroorotate dehydrogenase-like FAD/NAD-binding protein [Candidatus Margulisiibacteriota bacterium]